MATYDFSTFQVTDANRMAVEVCMAIAAFRSESPNPVVLVGSRGTGKTHLLHAIVAEMRPTGAKIGSVTPREPVERIRALVENPGSIRRAEKAVLLVDQLERCEPIATELEALLRIFLSSGHPIVIASRVHPIELEGIGAELRDLLLGGRLVDLDASDMFSDEHEARVATQGREDAQAVLERVSQQAKELESEKEKLHRQLEDEHSVREDLGTKLEHAEQRALSFEQKLRAAREENEELKSVVERAIQRAESSERELLEIRNLLDAQRQRAEQVEAELEEARESATLAAIDREAAHNVEDAVAAREAELEAARLNMERQSVLLEDALAESDATATQLAEARRRLEELERSIEFSRQTHATEILKLERDLEAKTEAINDFAAKTALLQTLQLELDEAVEAAEVAVTERNELRAAVDSLHASLQNAQTEISEIKEREIRSRAMDEESRLAVDAQWRQQLESVGKELEEATNDLNRLSRSEKELLAALDEAAARENGLRAEIEQRAASDARLRETMDESRASEEERRVEMDRLREDLRLALARAEHAEREIEKLREDARAVELVEDMKVAVEGAQAATRRAEEQFEVQLVQIEKLRGELSSAEADRDRAQAMYAEMSANVAANAHFEASLKMREGEVAALESRIHDLEEEVRRALELAETAESSRREERERAEHHEAQLREALDKANAAVESEHRARAEGANLLKERENELADLRAQLDEAHEAGHLQQAELEQVSDELRELKRQIDPSAEHALQQKELVQDLEQQLALLQEDFEKTRSERDATVADLERKRAVLEAAHTHAQQEINDSKAELEHQLARLEVDYREIQDKSESEISTLNRRIEELEAECRRLREERDTLTADSATLEASVAAIELEAAAAVAGREELEQELSALRSQQPDFTAIIEGARRERDELAAALDNEKSETEDLKAELEHLAAVAREDESIRDRLEDALEDLRAAQEEIRGLREEGNALNARYAALETASTAARESAEDELAQARREHSTAVSALETQLVASLAALEEVRDKHAADVEALARIRSVNADLDAQIEEIKARHIEYETEVERRIETAIRTERNRLEIENRAAADRAAQRITELSQERDHARRQLQELQDRLSSIRDVAGTVAGPPASIPVELPRHEPPKEERIDFGAFRAGRKRIRMGELLVGAGVVTQDELDDALREQSAGSRRKLGTILVEKGYTTETVIAQVLAAQLSLPYVRLSEQPLDRRTVNVLSPKLARKHDCVPLRITGDELTVAMANPLDLIAIDDVELATNRHVSIVVATKADIENAHASLYRP